MHYIVAALYKFVSLPHFKDLQIPLQELCRTHKIFGTLLLAQEGINGTVAGSRVAIDALKVFLEEHIGFSRMEYKESHASENPFYRMKVRLKKEIVTLGVPGVDPTQKVGTYVSPKEWDELIEDPDVIVLDTRNDYEVEIGTFQGAMDPKTKSFREFPKYVKENLDPKKHRKVAMFCTGGIRCEKASSFMLEQGFENVYHLKGGILKYLEEVPQETSSWQGECFVFDGRVGVSHGLEEGKYELCYACRNPIADEDKKSQHFVLGISCPKCFDKTTAEQKRRFADRQKQLRVAKERGASGRPGYGHIGQAT